LIVTTKSTSVIVGSYRINRLLVAEKWVLLASYEQGLQHALDRFSAACDQTEIKITIQRPWYYVSLGVQVPWGATHESQSGSFQTPQSCQFLNWSLYLFSDPHLKSWILGNNWKSATSSAKGRYGIFAKCLPRQALRLRAQLWNS